MTAKIDLFSNSILEIKKHLRTYLEEEGIESTSGRYLCINPDHDDTNPSSTIYTDENGGQHLRCWSCNLNVDVFAAAHILEKLPISGTGFFTETIPNLGKRFNVEIPEYVMSDREREEIALYRIYNDAAKFITSYTTVPENVSAELNKRGWTDLSKIKELGIGYVSSHEVFRNHLKSLGYTVKAIEDSGLSDPYLFRENRLIFTYNDEHGRAVGFIARNLEYTGLKDPETHLYYSGPKYIFNKNPSSGVRLLKKEQRLYLLDKAKRTQSPVVYIVEGQPDSVSFHYSGHDNFVSLSGVTLTLDHFELLRRYGIYDIVVCLDNDSPGIKAAESLIETVLKHVTDIRVRFMFLPMTNGEKIDPDLMARDGKIDEFFELPKINPFDFSLNKVISENEDSGPELICNKVLPTVLSDPSSIRRELMIGTLSTVTGISEKALKEEVKRLLENKDQKLKKLKSDVITKLTSRLEEATPIEAESLISDALESIRQIDKEGSSEGLSPKALLGTLLEIKRYEEGETLMNYLRVDPNLELFMKAIEGDLAQKLVFIPASPNVGKTSLFVNLIHSFVKNNENLIVAFLSIDDSLKEIIPRFICYNVMDRNGIDSDIGHSFTINHFSTPLLYKDSPNFQTLLNERNIAFKEVGGWISDGRLLILDSENGRSFEFLSTTIRNLRDKYPGKQIVFFLDNLHLLTTDSWNEQGSEKIKKLSHETKALAVSTNTTIISTVELRKLQKGQKADNNDLAGSASLAYDSNAIILLHSELDGDPSSPKFFKHANSNRKYPIIECHVSKNKIGSFKGYLYAKLYAAQAFYKFIPEHEFNCLYGDSEAEEYARGLIS